MFIDTNGNILGSSQERKHFRCGLKLCERSPLSFKFNLNHIAPFQMSFTGWRRMPLVWFAFQCGNGTLGESSAACTSLHRSPCKYLCMSFTKEDINHIPSAFKNCLSWTYCPPGICLNSDLSGGKQTRFLCEYWSINFYFGVYLEKLQKQ